jgi:hypothetical protein
MDIMTLKALSSNPSMTKKKKKRRVNYLFLGAVVHACDLSYMILGRIMV